MSTLESVLNLTSSAPVLLQRKSQTLLINKTSTYASIDLSLSNYKNYNAESKQP
jgi:hypothetical protein